MDLYSVTPVPAIPLGHTPARDALPAGIIPSRHHTLRGFTPYHRPVIPIGTDRGLSRPTVVNHILVGVNVLIFCAVGAAGIQSEKGLQGVEHIYDRWMLTRALHEPWRLLTYAFLHDMSSIWHLAGNMIFLWVMGPNVEDRLGRIGYLCFYLAAAIAAGLGHILMSPAPAVGASGAIAAVTGAYMVLFPRTQIRVLFFFFFVGVLHLSALWFVSIEILINLFRALTGHGDNVAYTAHLAGYAFGFCVALALLMTGILKSETFDMFHLFRQARRRAEIKEAYRESAKRTDTAFVSAEAAKARAAEAEISDLQKPIAQARADVAARLGAGDLPGAGAAYRSLVEKYGLVRGAATMSRRFQLDLANHFFQTQDFGLSVATYERFLEGYPRDPESAHVKLMLAVIAGRYLHQLTRARTLLDETIPTIRDPDQLAMAQELLAEFAAPTTPTTPTAPTAPITPTIPTTPA